VLQILFALAIAGGMVAASYFIGKHKRSRTKLGAYECGMDPVGDARGRFSVRFYMVAMLFILFDVEAVFMLPWAVIYRRLPGYTGGSKLFGFWEILVYLGFVAVGLFYVWKKGILDWSNDKADL
jgi:NADH-quinone oxidoreductase subunit A